MDILQIENYIEERVNIAQVERFERLADIAQVEQFERVRLSDILLEQDILQVKQFEKNNNLAKLKYLDDCNIIPEIGDGNCLLRTFARKLYPLNNSEYYDFMRCQIVDYLETNKNLWENFLDKTDYPNTDAYLRHISVNGTWCDGIEINAFTNITGCTVIVHNTISLYMIIHIPIRNLVIN